MDLQRAKELAEKEIVKHWPRTQGWRFEFDTAEKRFGACFYLQKKITLSQVLTQLNDEETVLEAIRHEITHAIAGFKAGHGHDWKLVCAMTGAKPVACYNSAEVVCSAKSVMSTKLQALDDILKFKL